MDVVLRLEGNALGEALQGLREQFSLLVRLQAFVAFLLEPRKVQNKFVETSKTDGLLEDRRI